jgi:NTP pyrophosphatase (non-canonical NTP hydrolase)
MNVVPMPTIATRTALEAFGGHAQAQIAIEEMAELTVALKHYERNRVGIAAVQEELADVCIVIAQLVDVFGRDAVVEIAKQKQERLMHRILNRR